MSIVAHVLCISIMCVGDPLSALTASHQVKSLTLFVTHYPVLAQIEDTFPGTVGNFHMAYVETETTGQSASLTVATTVII